MLLVLGVAQDLLGKLQPVLVLLLFVAFLDKKQSHVRSMTGQP